MINCATRTEGTHRFHLQNPVCSLRSDPPDEANLALFAVNKGNHLSDFERLDLTARMAGVFFLLILFLLRLLVFEALLQDADWANCTMAVKRKLKALANN